MKRKPESKRNYSRFPSCIGRYPFEPGKKIPCLLEKSLKRVYGREPHRIPTELHISTDLLTVTSFRIPPGGHINPPDIHAGDELYWVLRGSVTIANPETGQTETIKTSEAVWIPEGTWHHTFNTIDETLEVLSFFSPTIWSKSSQGTDIYYDKGYTYFSTSSSKTLTKVSPQNPKGERGRFPGGWPPEWINSRDKKTLLKLCRDNTFNLIWGKEHFCQASVYLSCERQHILCLIVPPEGRSDLEKHAGDEIIYCLSGEISLLTGEDATEEKSVSVKRLLAHTGEMMFIPSGVEHCYYNFGDKVAHCVMGVAPQIEERR